ncbi:MAG TPA: epimerase [Thermoplasmata archaeon]|nr:epimerase [Thermoplasmata archaeon]
MKVILFGASGMVGSGVLRECLADPSVVRVLCVGRHPLGRTDPKLAEITVPDLTDLVPVADALRGYDAGFFCLGVSSAGLSEADYRRVTHDLTLSVARTLAPLNPGMTFVYVSGAGTDSTERKGRMWARVKGETENDLLRLPFRAAYMFRPGVIQARHGIRSRTRVYRILYAILFPFVALVGLVAPNSITSTDRLGRAMIHVVERGAPQPWLGTREINRLAA